MSDVSVNASGPADLVLTNARVYTVDAVRRWAEAVAIRGDRIVAVGTAADMEPLTAVGTRVRALGGRMVVPGFQDAHIHPPSGGIVRLQCDLHDAYGKDEYLRIIRDYADSHPDAQWVLGAGWSMDAFPGGTPLKEDADRIVPDRPLILYNRDGHGAWANSRALEIASIDRNTPDPPDGRIERDADGEPSGTLHEGAMHLVDRLVPEATQQEYEEGIRVAQAYLHSLGITAWQDAIVGEGILTSDSFPAYVALAERGELTARVVGALWWERDRGAEQIKDMLELRRRAPTGRFRTTSVKIMQDGVLENFTGGVLEPYLGNDGKPTDNRGLSFVDPELLKGYVTELDREGFQVHFHAIGERAVREALDSLEAARRENGPNDLRHHIAHIQVIHPDDIPRFRELGVVANGQPLWAMLEGQMINLTIPFLGPERSTWQYPFGSLVRSGAVLAFGSDWSVSSPDPLWEMHVAVNRKAPSSYPYIDGETHDALLPEERIDLGTAIAAFTIGTAYVNHLDAETGSIERGKLADLAVVDRDLFAAPPEEIAEANVVMTLVDGKAVHDELS
ncbi:MAG: amidohydrolase [Actinomycetota bacterium]